MDILFDLDGTLTDPGLGITRCLQHALGRLGRAVPPAESLRCFIGPPLQSTFAELLGTRDGVQLERAIGLYRERYASVGLFENQVYPDVPAGLERLSQRGHRLWLATSKPHVFARRILEHFRLDHWFAGVYGSELSGSNAHKSDLLRELLRQEGLRAETTFMVGDRVHDVQGARANGIRVMAVQWGYGGAEELAQARPDWTAATMAELCERFEGAVI